MIIIMGLRGWRRLNHRAGPPPRIARHTEDTLYLSLRHECSKEPYKERDVKNHSVSL